MTDFLHRLLAYLSAVPSPDAQLLDLMSDAQALLDHPLEHVITGGEVADMCKSMGQKNLYQTMILAGLHKHFISRKASAHSLLIDRDGLMAWLVAHQERRRKRRRDVSGREQQP